MLKMLLATPHLSQVDTQDNHAQDNVTISRERSAQWLSIASG
jgi:hypothetical protein